MTERCTCGRELLAGLDGRVCARCVSYADARTAAVELDREASEQWRADKAEQEISCLRATIDQLRRERDEARRLLDVAAERERDLRAAIYGLKYRRNLMLHRSGLRQIAKACRDLRRTANLDASPDVRSFLEEIEAQLDGVEE